MSLLGTADIQRMRTTLEGSLSGTAVVRSAAFVDDGGGGGTQGWAVAGTVACRVASLTGNEREIAGRISPDATWIITLPAETDVGPEHQIVVTNTDHDGTFDVLAVRGWTQATSTRVECVEVL